MSAAIVDNCIVDSVEYVAHPLADQRGCGMCAAAKDNALCGILPPCKGASQPDGNDIIWISKEVSDAGGDMSPLDRYRRSS